MDHIYTCAFLNEKKPEINYEKLYNGNLRSQIEIFRKMESNLKRRNQIRTQNNVPCDPSDPLNCYQSRFG